jgi:hypothetical protein
MFSRHNPTNAKKTHEVIYLMFSPIEPQHAWPQGRLAVQL